MKHPYGIRAYAICFLSMTSCLVSSYDAYVIVPVADLVGEPMTNEQVYGLGEQKYTSAFPRIHQLLYQEPVRVLKTKGNQVLISVGTIFYITATHKKPITSFWTLKKYLIPAHAIKGDLRHLPSADYFDNWDKEPIRKDVITLTHPHYDPVSDLTFSAGTRFIQAPSEKQKKYYTVFVLDPKTYAITTTKLPKDVSKLFQEETPEEKIKNFIHLIRSWIAHPKNRGYIPYVWGGTSVQTYTTAHEPDTQIIKTGCDCSGLIFRAANICAIPYFFKNSYTATNYLTPLSKDIPLSEGDIISVPGHVMIVADLKKNTLFEERGHEHGYGKLHEIPLKKVFKGIKTYQDLEDAYYNRLPLYRMDITGTLRDRYAAFTILRLSSAWDSIYGFQKIIKIHPNAQDNIATKHDK